MIGDWGGQPSAPYYTRAEADIADQMGKKATEVGARFTVALGDNFYDEGVKNVDDPRFKETFEVGFSRCKKYEALVLKGRASCKGTVSLASLNLGYD